MILYVNGDSNSSGAELTDPTKSWPQLLANRLGWPLINEAKSGTSNPRILRVASNTLAHSDKNTFTIIGWTSWEREEWFYQNQYYDVNSGGHDAFPQELEQRYKAWVTEQGIDQRAKKSFVMHSQIHRVHRSLRDRRMPHLFFNAVMPFQHNHLDTTQLQWHNQYLGPYDNDLSYFWYLKKQGFCPTKFNHYVESAQEAWADVLYNYIQEKELV